MTGVTDRMQVGYFPLQDHRHDIPVGTRQSLAGVRILRMDHPDVAGTAEASALVVARENDLGTLGDIHPWTFWQTKDRAERDVGSWAMGYAAMTTRSAFGGTARHRVHPLHDPAYRYDHRYAAKSVHWPEGFPSLPKGVLVNLASGTEESAQHDVMLYGDPRLFAPHTAGPDEASTLVCDLQPSSQPCMEESEIPGIGGRHARLSTFLRVIPIRENDPISWLRGNAANAIAWNGAKSGVGGIPGYGMMWCEVPRGAPSGPTTSHPGTSGPTTPGSIAGQTSGRGGTKPRLIDPPAIGVGGWAGTIVYSPRSSTHSVRASRRPVTVIPAGSAMLTVRTGSRGSPGRPR